MSIDTKQLLEHDLKNQLDILESERTKVTSNIRFLLVYGHIYWSVIIGGFVFFYLISLFNKNEIWDNIFMYSFIAFGDEFYKYGNSFWRIL